MQLSLRCQSRTLMTIDGIYVAPTDGFGKALLGLKLVRNSIR